MTAPLPTRTPVGEVVAAFIEHMRAHRPERSWRRDLSYLRESFSVVLLPSCACPCSVRCRTSEPYCARLDERNGNVGQSPRCLLGLHLPMSSLLGLAPRGLGRRRLRCLLRG